MFSPRALKVGDRVAIIAPASPFRSDELTQGLDILSEAGLIPVLGPNVGSIHSNRDLAASTSERVKELMWAFSDPEIKGVIAATGGYGSAQLLPYLDFRVIQRSRKILLGMSDISALCNGIAARSNLITVNGQYPSLRIDEGQRFFKSDSKSMEFTLKMLMSTDRWGERPFELNQFIPRTISSGIGTGPAFGVNLHVLQHMIGTPFMPSLTGAVLFIEGVHQDGQMVGRQLTQLQTMGIIERLAAVVVGEFVEVPKKEKPTQPSIEDVLISFFKGGPPTVVGYSFSHGALTIPIPVGATTTVNADTGEVYFDFALT